MGQRKKYCTMVGFQLKAAALLAVLATTQCLANDESPISSPQSAAQASHSAYFTEMMVQSPSLEPTKCSDKVLEARKTATVTQGVKPTVSLQAALLIFLGVGIFAVFIAQAFQMVRKYVYRDADNLDTAFDAGGKVSIGLTATTIVSQWTWSATLLQSSTVASKYGISGPYWYAGGATIQIIIFSILSIMLKTRAPGAKTFLQVIKARFGARTHLVFCTFAFFTNLIVMMSLTVAGTAVLNSLVADLSPELAAMLLAVVIGGYTLIGGSVPPSTSPTSTPPSSSSSSSCSWLRSSSTRSSTWPIPSDRRSPYSSLWLAGRHRTRPLATMAAPTSLSSALVALFSESSTSLETLELSSATRLTGNRPLLQSHSRESGVSSPEVSAGSQSRSGWPPQWGSPTSASPPLKGLRFSLTRMS